MRHNFPFSIFHFQFFGDFFGHSGAVEGCRDDAARIACTLTRGVEPLNLGVAEQLFVAGYAAPDW